MKSLLFKPPDMQKFVYTVKKKKMMVILLFLRNYLIKYFLKEIGIINYLRKNPESSLFTVTILKYESNLPRLEYEIQKMMNDGKMIKLKHLSRLS